MAQPTFLQRNLVGENWCRTVLGALAFEGTRRVPGREMLIVMLTVTVMAPGQAPGIARV